MSKKDEIKKLWAETFGDSREFVEMYFDRVYRDTDAMTLLSDDGRIISSLLLQPYGMQFHGLDATVSYIAGAVTRRNMRGRGLMSALMLSSLEESRSRGDILTLLIPASDYLYGFYARFGFATVAFTDIMRYTSLHSFMPPEDSPFEEYTAVDDLFDDRIWEAAEAMERDMQQSVVLHSRRDFLNIMDDLRLDEGMCAAVTDAAGEIAAIAWGRPAPDGSGIIRVDEILYRSPGARLAVLRQLRANWPDKPFAVMAPVSDDGRRLTRRGMARIVNAGTILGLLAAATPDLRTVIRLSDPVMPENSGIYSVARGECTVIGESELTGAPDFDIDIVTLAEILFSSPAIGSVMGIPSRRLHMALMLD